MRRFALLIGIALAATACTEHLTTPGSCPTFCPGGQSVFRDTVLTPVPNGDSSFTGYLEASSLISVLASSGGDYGLHDAVIRFLGRGDSVLVADSGRTFTVDSVTIELGLQDRDTTETNFYLDIYRLPLTIDSASSYADVEAQLTPAHLIASVPEPPTYRYGVFHVTFSGDSLAALAFAPSDSTVLELGFKVRADGPTGARIGTPASGTYAPLVTTWVEANGVADSLRATSIGRTASSYFTVTPPVPPPPSDLLAVGGIPVSRSFLRFALPTYLKDSATIIRATLHLQTAAPVFGIPADTAQLVAGAVLADFGAKSPIVSGVASSALLLPGATSADIEVLSLVQLWQGTAGLPPIIRLSLAQEGGTFIFPLFYSTRSNTGTPTLDITYRPPFAFAGY